MRFPRHSLAFLFPFVVATVGCELNELPEATLPAADAGTTEQPTEPAPLEPTDIVTDGGTGEQLIDPEPEPEPENAPPSVGPLSIEGVLRLGQQAIFIANAEDPDGILSCQVAINASGAAGMDLQRWETNDDGLPTAVTAQAVITATATGRVSYQVVCVDAQHAVGRSPLIEVTVLPPLPPPPGPDRILPTVQLLAPLPTHTQDVRDPIAVSASYYDAGLVTGCDVLVDGVPQAATIAAGETVGTGNATASVALTATSNHTVAVRCIDAAGNAGTSDVHTVALTRPPGLGTLTASATSVNAGTSIAFSAPVEARTTMASCTLRVDDVDERAATVTGVAPNAAAGISTPIAAGTHAVSLRCTDTLGATHDTNAVTVTVLADTVAPALIGGIGWNPPDAALTNGAPYAFTSTWQDAFGVTACSITFTDGVTTTAPGTMALTPTGGLVIASALIGAYNGMPTVTMSCRDAAGNVGTASAPLTVAVPPPPTPDPPVTP